MIDAELNRLTAELDHWAQSGRSISLWLRDDDAVAPSTALSRLGGLGERFGLPVLLAVIPTLAQPALADALAAMPALLPCQHGVHHENRAPAGAKKSEFGPTRPRDAAIVDIAVGRHRLADLLGPAVLPVFVPPWNRITPEIALGLPDLGLTGLSCFRGFSLDCAEPVLVNTDIDVMDWHGGRIGRSLAELAAEIRAQLAVRRERGNTTLGILLHHRDHDETAWAALDILLEALIAHPAIRVTDPRHLFQLLEPS